MDGIARKQNLYIQSNNLIKQSTPLDMGRRILAYEMATSAKNIPHVCFNYEPDVTDFINYFNKLKKERGISVTINTLVIRCIIEGLKAAPKLNSHLNYKYKSARGTLTTFDFVNVNMPTILPDGTMQALNIRNADKYTLCELEQQIRVLLQKFEDEMALGQAQIDLSLSQTLNFLAHGKPITCFSRLFWALFGKERIRMNGYNSIVKYAVEVGKYNKTVKKDTLINKYDLNEGTIMISNIGSIGRNLRGHVTMFELIPPQIFGVLVGNLQRQSVVSSDIGEESIDVKTILPLTLAFDHRACDFGNLIPFINRMDEVFANPHILDEWL